MSEISFNDEKCDFIFWCRTILLKLDVKSVASKRADQTSYFN